MLINAGYSPEEAAAELGVSESDIMNTKNWSGDVFTFAGLSYQFKFGYTGSMFTKI